MRRQRGFTLVEVIISLTLLTMIMAGVITAMRTFGNTKTTLDSVTSRVDEIRLVSRFLRSRLSAALPVAGDGLTDSTAQGGFPGENDIAFFVGDSQRVTWVAPVIAGADVGGAHVMQLVLNQDRLELFWQPYQRDAALFVTSELKPRILLEGVETFTVGYLDHHGGEWVEEWGAARDLPVAVRMTVKAADKYWPELVIGLSGASVSAR